MLDITCELSAGQTIHTKCQALFPLKKDLYSDKVYR